VCSSDLRHAEAKNVAVSLVYGDGGIEMEIGDDGKGFDARQVFGSVKAEGRMGLGLLGMEERVALLDGRLTVRSEPGKGTRIQVHVPVPA
jgi:signal transduction histidine kinase